MSAPSEPNAPARIGLWRALALAAGPAFAGLMYIVLSVATPLDHAPKAVAAAGVWMAFWWITEAVPLPATSLMPLVLFPLLGAAPIADAARPYAHPLVFLFMGGFILGLAVERWGLHKRVALSTVLLVGTKPTRLIAGFMLATAVLSMFISNTATTIMLLPIAVSVIALLERIGQPGAGAAGFAPALVLGIAYASSIGGVSTITGTQPNLLLVGFLADEGVEVSWGSWLPLGLTLAVIMLPLCWLILTKIALPVRTPEVPGAHDLLRGELRQLGRLGRGEWIVLAVFAAVALGWVLRVPVTSMLSGAGMDDWAGRLTALGDPGIAMLGAIALFVIPVHPSRGEFAIDWRTANRMPWDVLLLFGGGLSLAAAMKATGLDVFLGDQVAGLRGVPDWVLISLVCASVVLLTELTSNTATTAALVPVLGAAAPGLGVHPALLMVPAAVAASYAFMLPVATPPNAIVFSSGRVGIRQMARTGLLLNIAGAAVIALVMSTVGLWLLGIDTGS